MSGHCWRNTLRQRGFDARHADELKRSGLNDHETERLWAAKAYGFVGFVILFVGLFIFFLRMTPWLFWRSFTSIGRRRHGKYFNRIELSPRTAAYFGNYIIVIESLLSSIGLYPYTTAARSVQFSW